MFSKLFLNVGIIRMIGEVNSACIKNVRTALVLSLKYFLDCNMYCWVISANAKQDTESAEK